MGLISWLIIGAIAGWLAGVFTRGGGFGLVANVILGVVGAVVGGFLFGLLGFETVNFVGSLITATVGAVVLLSAIRLVKTA